MEQRLTFAVSSDTGADQLYNQLTSVFGLRVTGSEVDLIRRGRRFTDIWFPEHVKSGQPDNYKFTISQFISNYIVDFLEIEILRRMIFKQYGAAGDDLEQIVEYSRKILNETEAGSNGLTGRRDYICKELITYFCCRSFLDIEGFVRFRLKNYVADLHDTVEYAIDEFMLNKQYQEFIALLKYFVYFQDTKIPEAHLIHHGDNKFILLDSELNPLDLSGTDEVVVETIDRELNYEDMIVSALISASPKKIYIHTREPETQSIKTIRQIFEERTYLCTCCKFCKPILGGRDAKNPVAHLTSK